MSSPRSAKGSWRGPQTPAVLQNREFGGILYSDGEGSFFCTSRDFPGIIAEAGRKLTAQKYLAETICFEVSDGSYQVPVPVKQVTDSEHQAWAKQRIAANRRVIPDSKLKFELIRIKF